MQKLEFDLQLFRGTPKGKGGWDRTIAHPPTDDKPRAAPPPPTPESVTFHRTGKPETHKGSLDRCKLCHPYRTSRRTPSETLVELIEKEPDRVGRAEMRVGSDDIIILYFNDFNINLLPEGEWEIFDGN